jgi:hypothetical protein
MQMFGYAGQSPEMIESTLATEKQDKATEEKLAENEARDEALELEKKAKEIAEFRKTRAELAERGVNLSSKEGAQMLYEKQQSALGVPEQQGKVAFAEPNVGIVTAPTVSQSPQYTAAQKQIIAGIGAETEIQSKTAQEIAKVQEDLIKKHEATYGTAEQQAQELKRRAEEIKKYSDNYTSAMDDVKNFKMTNPDIWGNMSTGQKIVAGIGMMFSSVSTTATKNVLESMDKAVDRDIETQKNRFNMLKDRAEGAKTLYSMNMQRFQDEDMAKLATKNQAAQLALMQGESLIQSSKSDLFKAQGMQKLGAFKQEIANNQAKLEIMAAQKAEKGKFSIRELDKVDDARDARDALEEYYAEYRKAGIGSKVGSKVFNTQLGYARERALNAVSKAEGIDRKNLEKEFPVTWQDKQTGLNKIEKRLKQSTNRYEMFKTAKPAGGSQFEESTTEGI